VLIDEFLKQHIHYGLECGGAIAQPKEHGKWLKQPVVCSKCCLPLISLLDAYIVVTPLNIDLGEIFSL
jgi:hypothetical protein